VSGPRPSRIAIETPAGSSRLAGLGFTRDAEIRADWRAATGLDRQLLFFGVTFTTAGITVNDVSPALARTRGTSF
jgi:hypothetical protein